MSEEDYFSEIDDTTIEEEIKPFDERKVTSIYDIAYLYGSMSNLANYSEYKKDLEIDFDRDNFAVLTPDLKTDDVIGETDTLLAIKLDFTDPENPKYSGHEFEEPEKKDIVKSAYCRPANKSSQSCAHSMSQKTSGSGYTFDDLIDKNIENNLLKWYQNSDYNVKNECKFTKSLSNLDDEHQLIKDIKSDTNMKKTMKEESSEDDITNFMGIVTFRIKTEENGEYRDLLDIPAHNNITYHRKMENRFKGYSGADDTYVDDIDETFIDKENQGATGVVPGTPLNYKTFKQQGFFSDFDGSSESQRLPLTLTAALRVSSGKKVVEKYNVNLGQIDSETVNKIYKIPYVRDIDVQSYKYLYSKYVDYLKFRKKHDNPNLNNFILEEIERDGRSYDIDYYMSYIYPKQNSLYKLLEEEKTLNKIANEEVDDNHIRIIGSNNVQMLNHYEEKENDEDERQFFDNEINITKVASNKQPPRLAYFSETFPLNTDEDMTFSPADPKIKAYINLYRGKPMSYEFLVRNYSERLGNVENNIDSYPFTLVTKQYVQLVTLAMSNLLQGKNLYSTKLISDSMNETKNIDAFIESHDAIREDPERRGAFLVGSLIGNLSAYQESERVSTKMYDKYPSNYLTKSNISEVISNANDKLCDYMSKEERYGNLSKGREYLKKVNDIVADREPNEWNILLSDLRMHYALGITFGFEQFFSTKDSEEEGDTNE